MAATGRPPDLDLCSDDATLSLGVQAVASAALGTLRSTTSSALALLSVQEVWRQAAIMDVRVFGAPLRMKRLYSRRKNPRLHLLLMCLRDRAHRCFCQSLHRWKRTPNFCLAVPLCEANGSH